MEYFKDYLTNKNDNSITKIILEDTTFKIMLRENGGKSMYLLSKHLGIFDNR